MYVCGPTVYDEPHIGHARAAYIFEMIRNFFEYSGYRVTFVKNITDIDDKIIARAKKDFPEIEINEAVRKISQTYTKSYYDDMQALGIRAATHAPCATEFIERMQGYIQRLIDKGFAYNSDGDVYFDVRSFKEYGALSHQNLDQMKNSVRIESDKKKKDPLDFALWKGAKEGEPFWQSPWGKGRPGWHIECSVMSSKFLGDQFDIHGGGQDLLFPHHENEVAQSRCYSGKTFARTWIHNGLLTIDSQKMAKSLGNFVSIKDFLKENMPDVLKLFFISAHYRSAIDYNSERVNEAKKTYERFRIFYNSLNSKLSKETSKQKVKKKTKVDVYRSHFEEALADDFNTPKALAAIFDLMAYCNKALNIEGSYETELFFQAKALLDDCAKIFGISFTQDLTKDVDRGDIEKLIKARNDARVNGDYALADKLRVDLESQGIVLEDTKEETLWRKKL